jgi:BTB/POZ domain
VVVGESKTFFYLHKDLFCEVSRFFTAGLNGGFREAEDQTLSFPEDDVDIFKRFVQWVYTKSFNLASDDTMGETSVRYFTLTRLYILADKLQVPSLMKKTIQTMYQTVRVARWLPNSKLSNYIYDRTHQKSGLRRLVVAIYVWRRDYKWYDRNNCVNDLLNMRDFPAELAIALAQRISRPTSLNPILRPVIEIGASEFYDEDPEETGVHQTVAQE